MAEAPRRVTIGGAGRAFAILVVFLLTAEVTARVDDALFWKTPLASLHSQRRLTIVDSLGHRGRPDYRYEKWRMNNLGFRGVDVARDADPGVTRVAVLGASETFGLQESEGAEYPRRMQVVLDSLAPRQYEVVNTALPGMTMLSMVPYYTQVVTQISPDIVVIYPSPSFYLATEPLPDSLPASLPARPAKTLFGVDRTLFDSRLADRVINSMKRLIPTAAITWYRDRKLARIRASEGADWVWEVTPPERLSLFDRHLDRLVSAVRESGAHVVLVTHTNRFLCGDELRGPDRQHLINLMATSYPRASDRVMANIDLDANEVIRQVARRHGAGLIEVEGRIPPATEYFVDYSHFTDLGADLMAHIVANGLLEGPMRDSGVR